MIRDRYEIRGCLGVGRLGVVLRVFDHDGGAEVALKVLHAALVPDEDAGARLLLGLRDLRNNKHPAMARIHDANCEGTRYFFTRQLIDGTPLSRLLAGRRGRGYIFTAREALPVIAQVASLLSGELVHGGLCPDDIWVLPDQLKVTDAGLVFFLPAKRVAALLTSVPRYNGFVAPEVARGTQPDTRSDVFSLGALLGELLTQVEADGSGRSFRDRDDELPEELSAIIEKAMQPKPYKRYSEPAALLAALEKAITGVVRAHKKPPAFGGKLSPRAKPLRDKLKGAPEVPDGETPPPVLAPHRPTQQSAAGRVSHHSEPPPPPPLASPVKLAKVILAGGRESALLGPRRPTPMPPPRPSAKEDEALHQEVAAPDIIDEVELNDHEPTGSQTTDSALSKLESELRAAERRTTEELLRRSSQLEGVDPRLVRAAHAIETEKASNSTAQAATILRKRAEKTDLAGIDPRLLRAAARLESARVTSVPAPDPAEPDDPDAWREEISSLKQDQIISFLSPPVSTKQREVTGFPRNQQPSPTAEVPPPRRPTPPVKRKKKAEEEG
jgi:serine/threonine protein kinase